ncbi:hypothetical protein V1264_014420 [Littorina saxatilis]|uniref:NR LBD domain-containing protein n=1 Tax=Littorina saxatilis TaxID=31220 RepID=A0AAN9BSN7_9CAEN
MLMTHNITGLLSGEEEKRARLTKRDREGPSPGPKWEKRYSQSSEPQSTNFRAPILSPNSTNSTASPGSSVDSGIDVGTTAGAASTSQLNYPDKGKWCRPKNALGKHFKHVAREDLPWDMQLFWPLQAEERSLLTKLTSAYQSVTTNTTMEDLEKMRQWGSFCMEKAIFALEYSMREYVEFARVIPEFKQLRQGDQIAVLKASALMWYHIRLASDFIPERRSWVNAFGAMSEVDLGNFLGDPHSVQEYAEFCEGLKFVVKNDTTLYTLMHTLVLFDPRDSKVEDRIMVNTLKDKYLVLLKHHLESQFSFLHADRYMAEIAQQILDLRQLGESSLIFYKHFQSQFRPLIAEVFAD